MGIAKSFKICFAPRMTQRRLAVKVEIEIPDKDAREVLSTWMYATLLSYKGAHHASSRCCIRLARAIEKGRDNETRKDS
jgi:hypothetical protein